MQCYGRDRSPRSQPLPENQLFSNCLASPAGKITLKSEFLPSRLVPSQYGVSRMRMVNHHRAAAWTAVACLALGPWAAIVLAADKAETPETPSENSWAWKKPAAPSLPRVQKTGWVRNPIDAFILAKLEAAGLSPA